MTGNTFGVPFAAPGDDGVLGTTDDVLTGKLVIIVPAEDTHDKHDHDDD